MTRPMQGLRAWLWQRVSALYLALFLPAAVFYLWVEPPASYAAWRETLASPALNVAVGLFGVALLVHAWVGARDVIVDYVATAWLRVLVLAVVALLLIGCGLWGARLLFGAAFG